MEKSTQLLGSAESVTAATIDRRHLLRKIVATVDVPDLNEKVGMVGFVASSMPLENRPFRPFSTAHIYNPLIKNTLLKFYCVHRIKQMLNSVYFEIGCYLFRRLSLGVCRALAGKTLCRTHKGYMNYSEK